MRCNNGSVRRGQQPEGALGVETAKAGKPSGARPKRAAAGPPHWRSGLSQRRASSRPFPATSRFTAVSLLGLQLRVYHGLSAYAVIGLSRRYSGKGIAV